MMSVRVEISGRLRDYCGEQDEIAVAAGSVEEALGELAERFPALHRSVCDETGAVRRHVNLFVNSEWVTRAPAGLGQPLRPGDVLTIWPAVSGG